MGATCPLWWAPERGHIQSIPGGGGVQYGPHVPSNPLHDSVAPRAKDTPNRGSAPLVMGPQAGPYSMQSRGGRGAVRAAMCPLTPCMTPLHHVPRTRRTEGARPLSSHDVTQIAFHYFFALPLPLPLPLPPPFLVAGGAGFRI